MTLERLLRASEDHRITDVECKCCQTSSIMKVKRLRKQRIRINTEQPFDHIRNLIYVSEVSLFEKERNERISVRNGLVKFKKLKLDI